LINKYYMHLDAIKKLKTLCRSCWQLECTKINIKEASKIHNLSHSIGINPTIPKTWFIVTNNSHISAIVSRYSRVWPLHYKYIIREWVTVINGSRCCSALPERNSGITRNPFGISERNSVTTRDSSAYFELIHVINTRESVQGTSSPIHELCTSYRQSYRRISPTKLSLLAIIRDYKSANNESYFAIRQGSLVLREIVVRMPVRNPQRDNSIQLTLIFWYKSISSQRCNFDWLYTNKLEIN